MNRRVLLASLPVCLALLAASPPPVSASGTCIPPDVSASLAACSGVHLDAPPAKHTPATIAPVAPPARTAPRPPAAPDPALNAKELRRALASLRAMPLLIIEIEGLESLLKSTSAGSPDRPGILRRLADGYVELESASFRKKIESRMNADEARRKAPAKVPGLLAEAAKAEKVEKAARQAAIHAYDQLRAQYPRWCQTPASTTQPGCGNEVLYDLAYEHEQNGNPDQARKAYLELIQTAPASRYVPSAYLAFGELFFQEAQGDPSKWALAEQSYREVARYPAPDNKVAGYAHYKLAYVYWNKGDLALAVGELKKTIDVGRQFPALPNALQLATSARRDLIPLYALTGDAKKAYDFYHPLSDDGAGDSSHTYRWMAELGQGYLDVGRFHDGIEVYQDLLRRDRGAKSCEYQAHVTEATLALKSGDKAAAKAELDRQLQLELRFRAEGHPDEAIRACASSTAALAVETAMIWHLEAVGSGNVRGTMAPETMTFAADLYDRLIKQFTAEQFARFEFPRLVKEDWPSRLKVKAARADLLYAQKAWGPCGEAFDAVVSEEPRGPLAAESSYTSALCYQRASLAAHVAPTTKTGAVTPRELTPAEKAMVASFDRFLCIAKPSQADKAVADNYVEVQIARARTYFDAHRWAEAAAAFRPLALAGSDHDAGTVAAELYLEALNVMESHEAGACLGDMERDLPRDPREPLRRPRQQGRRRAVRAAHPGGAGRRLARGGSPRGGAEGRHLSGAIDGVGGDRRGVPADLDHVWKGRLRGQAARLRSHGRGPHQRGRSVPVRAPFGQGHRGAQGAARSPGEPRQLEARAARRLRHRAELPGHRRLRRGGVLVRALRPDRPRRRQGSTGPGGLHRPAARHRAGGAGAPRRRALRADLSREAPGADGADRLRHRRPLRRARGLRQGEAAPRRGHGRHRPERDRGRANPGARPAGARVLEDGRRDGSRSGVRPRARALQGSRGGPGQAEDPRGRRGAGEPAARQGAHRGGRGALLLGHAEAEGGRRAQVPGVQGLRPARGRAEAHRRPRCSPG